MRVLVTGATGFIGRALVPRLRRDGHEIEAWVRSPAHARSLLGQEAVVLPTGHPDLLQAAMARADAVVNLAGEPLIGQRWTRERRRALRESRVGLTGSLVEAMAAAPRRPRALVSGSAVGLYGDRGDERLTEESAPGHGFLADLCRDWEAAAGRAALLGVRVAVIRTGIVLGREGGALASMLPAFRLGLGGPFGGGQQHLPWIHLDDLVEVFAAAVADPRLVGPVNATAPEPVTVRDFARSLGRALRRPALLPVPGRALEMLFGEAATALLSSQRALPARLDEFGFRHRFADLDAALLDLTGDAGVRVERLTRESPRPLPGSDYLDRRRPTHLLRSSATLDAPLDKVFAFFAEAGNLGLITPASMRLRVLGQPPAPAVGARIDYELRVGGARLTWRARIERWEPGRLFVDAQESGPYRCWWHEHHFRAEGRRTVMEDRLFYAPPFGPPGRLASRFLVAPRLTRIFAYRRAAMGWRFGTIPERPEGRPAAGMEETVEGPTVH